MLGRTDSRGRLLAILVGLTVVASALMLRLGQWQIVQASDLAAKARAQTTIREEIPSRRGSIYDRSGTVLLATSVDRYLVAAAPDQMTLQQRGEVGDTLATILGLDDAGRAALLDKITQDRPYIILQHDIDETTAGRIRAGLAKGDLQQLSLEAEPLRSYPQPGGDPNTSLAAHLLGFVNRDGLGQYGVEQEYQSVLAGDPKVVVAQRGADNRPIPGTESVVSPGLPGSDLRLTIDAGLQLALEQELLAADLADQAKSISAVVMNPYTGEIYAEASAPSYNANDYATVAAKDPSIFVDPVISRVYEPGSVMKMLTAVAAFEHHTVGMLTKVNDSGVLKLDRGKTEVSDADHIAMGSIPFQDIVAYSRNVGVARVALGLGSTLKTSSTILHDTWLQLGLGKPTGVDLAGEVGGLVRDPALVPWRQIDLANGSFGQGVAVTPMQLATAYSAMVNGGTLVKPHVVAGIGDQQVIVAPKAEGVIPGSLIPTLTDLMHHVVSTVPAYRAGTLVPGYFVGGKTGTAQIWDTKTNAWKKNRFNYSFVGYIGKTHPEVIVAVRIEEARPSVLRQGLILLPVMSYELFRRIATNAMTILDLPAASTQPVASAAAAANGSSTDLAPAGATSP
jgi:cell division protein FtsI/penicillin-binding protein 2